jgi:hypothetical protein
MDGLKPIIGGIAAVCLLAVCMTRDPLPLVIAAATITSLIILASGMSRRR